MEEYGKFELLTCLAVGGMAEVFLARHSSQESLERVVVIKRILPRFANDEQFIRMFLQEARIAALLDHPNIIPIYDLGRIDESYFIAMPYVHGMTLLTMFKEASHQRIPVPLPVICEIIRQALAGLHYAHNHRGLDGKALDVVHRDISPNNLMVNDHGRVMLLDFGIASVADSTITRSGPIRGKLPYMSPEQVLCEPMDLRSDLFSLGVIFWELAAGQRLFRRKTDQEIIDAIASEPIPDPRQVRGSMPEPIAAVIRCALEREHRYASADDMSRALCAASERGGTTLEPSILCDFVERNYQGLLDSQTEKLRRAQAGELTTADHRQVDPLWGPSSRSVSLPLSRSARPTRKKRRALLWVGLATILALGAAGGVLAYIHLQKPVLEGAPLRVGAIPYLPQKVLSGDWAPLLRYLERQLGRPAEMVETHTYQQMIDSLVTGKVDMADLSAYPFLIARQRNPKIHLLAIGLTEKQKTYRAILVVRKDAPAMKLEDLRGKRICFVDRTSTSGYLMPRVMLRKAGFDPDAFFSSFQFSGDHYRALQDLLAGRCDAAAVADNIYQAAATAGLPIEQTRSLVGSDPVPHGVYCASSKMSKATAKRLRRALLDLDMRKEFGRDLLSPNLQLTGFAPVDPRAFDALQQEIIRTK